MNKLQTDILEKGFKVTPQRLAILRYLKENRVHPTAEKIYSEITRE
ncbi:MAG TPA: transcriptional repressor, partial [Smithella sp.]|nr:transcriptional repressor [Smithella sp.]